MAEDAITSQRCQQRNLADDVHAYDLSSQQVHGWMSACDPGDWGTEWAASD